MATGGGTEPFAEVRQPGIGDGHDDTSSTSTGVVADTLWCCTSENFPVKDIEPCSSKKCYGKCAGMCCDPAFCAHWTIDWKSSLVQIKTRQDSVGQYGIGSLPTVIIAYLGQ